MQEADYDPCDDLNGRKMAFSSKDNHPFFKHFFFETLVDARMGLYGLDWACMFFA